MTAPVRPAPSTPGLAIGIIGCGVMGRGIAQIAAQAGAHVQMFDSRAGAAAAACAELAKAYARLADKGKLAPADAQAASARLASANALADLAGCTVVIEAIVEDLAAKQALFAELEALLPAHAILATNTSSLPVTAIAAGLHSPERVAGFHFFNPVPLMRIVEVIGGQRSAPEVVDYLLALGRHWGHAAVRAKDTPGFIVNHAGRGYGTEGLRILAEGTCDFVVLDEILRDTAGFRLGPCELLDLTGLDVSHPVMESIYRQYFDEPRFRPQYETRQRLTAGMLGKKSGQGFYRYDEDGRKIAPPQPEAARGELPQSVWISRVRPALAERAETLLRDAGISIDNGERPADASLCVVTPLGDDATSCCVAEGLDAARTVGVETLFDTSRRRVLMSTPATSPAALAQAVAAFGHGAPVSVVRDSFGLVTQRVVAHIVNIACEIAQQGIAAPADIDQAVTLGLGYPQGPLAWGDALGPSTVLAILKNLERATGDPRYRPSPWLRRRALLGLSLHHQEN